MTVYANTLQVSCKAQGNKVIASFPDVCMTPPENPATPPGVPVPYPNFGLDTDTDKGTGTVKIGGKTVNQKNSSHFTKTTGDEAGAAAKKGVVSSKNTGKAYSQAYSMNVKAEGKNLTRFSDIQTNNHGSPANAPPWPKISDIYMPDGVDPCAGDKDAVDKNCPADKTLEEHCEEKGLGASAGSNKSKSSDAKLVFGDDGVGIKKGTGGAGISNVNTSRMKDYATAQEDPCLKARRCILFPKKDCDNTAAEPQCCHKQTGHHLIPEFSFSTTSHGDGTKYQDCGGYNPTEAPCMCVEGCCHTKGSHGLMHGEYYINFTNKIAGRVANGGTATTNLPFAGKGSQSDKKPYITYPDAVENAKSCVEAVFPGSDCSAACIEAQIKTYHDKAGCKDDTKLRCDRGPGRGLDDAKRRSADIDGIMSAAKRLK